MISGMVPLLLSPKNVVLMFSKPKRKKIKFVSPKNSFALCLNPFNELWPGEDSFKILFLCPVVLLTGCQLT